jgi:RNA polymerase sigma-70 factor, ECF subfamily
LEGSEKMTEHEEAIEFTSLSDDELFIKLVDLYGDMVKRVAFTYVRDIKMAEDIVQDVFIKCYNNLAHFQGKSTYKTWIYRITINHRKDVMRKRFFLNFHPFKEEQELPHLKRQKPFC